MQSWWASRWFPPGLAGPPTSRTTAPAPLSLLLGSRADWSGPCRQRLRNCCSGDSCGKPLSPLRLWGHTDLPETHVGHPCFLYSFISVMYRVIYPLLLFISRSLTLVVNILGSCNSKSNVFQVNVEDMKL